MGRVSYTVDAQGNTNAFAYDLVGRRIAVTNATYSPIQSVTWTAYDEDGRAFASTNALGQVSRTRYDSLGRAVAQLLPAVNPATGEALQRQTVYDAMGRRAQEIAEDGVITAFGYDLLGRLTMVTNDYTGSNQVVTAYGYDASGNQTTQTDALGRVTTFTHDLMGRRIGRSLPGATAIDGATFDQIGRTAWQTNFNGYLITNSYDIAGRLKERWVRDTNASPNWVKVEDNTYDDYGRRTQRVDEAGTWTWLYDSRGRVLTNSGPSGAIAYTYDSLGAVTGIASTNLNEASMNYTHDLLGRVSAVSGVLGIQADYRYTPVGSLGGIAYGNGVSNQFTYDSRMAVTNIAWKNGGTTLRRYQYTRDLLGQRTRDLEHDNAGSTLRDLTYLYDTRRRVTNNTDSVSSAGSTKGDFAYDKVGNRVRMDIKRHNGTSFDNFKTEGHLFDTNDFLVIVTNLLTTDIVTPTYDLAGNTREFNTTNFLYDWANRLTNVYDGGGNIRMVYDADGRRVRKEHYNGNTNLFLIDDRNPTGWSQVIQETTVTSSATTVSGYWVYGLQRIAGAVNPTSTASIRYYGYDALGSVRFTTDNPTSGSVNLDSLFNYDSYGRITVSSGAGASNERFRYTGEEWDKELNLYYLRARYYSPEFGRFWTMDSYEGNQSDPLSLHKYLYCHGNPVNSPSKNGCFGAA